MGNDIEGVSGGRRGQSTLSGISADGDGGCALCRSV